MIILPILVLLAAAYYFSTPDERARRLRAVLGAIRRLRDVTNRLFPESAPFEDALRARTRWAVVTPALVVVNMTVFVVMLFGAGAFSNPETLVRWGGNFGPRTTNGEWGRVVTAMFVHSGMLHLLANIAGLVQIGLMMERLFGRLAVAAAYVAAGSLGSLVSLYTHPVTVSAGASGAIFGIYGLLFAALLGGIAGRPQRSPVTVPMAALKRLGPAAGVFMLYSVVAGFDGPAEIAGFVVGFVYGLVLARGVSERTTPALRVAASMGVAVLIAVVSAVPLRGIADVRPELERVVAAEDRTASAYETALHRFHYGQISADGLAQVIDRNIVPELHEARAHLKRLERVPREHEPLMATADEYLRLREASWGVRSEALRKTNMRQLREADRTEKTSLEVFARIRPADWR